MTASEDSTDALRVVVVDDHELLAQALVIALRLDGVEAIPASTTSAAAVVRSTEDAAADLVLLDLDLGAPIGDGAELVPSLVATGARVLVLTGTEDPDRTAYALQLGAVGAVHKSVAMHDLSRTVVAAARGESVMTVQQRRDMVGAARTRRRQQVDVLRPFARLSSREGQVLRALASGSGVARIAAAWCVSEATVRSQVRGVLTKLGVNTQLEAVALAHRSGWLERDVPPGRAREDEAPGVPPAGGYG